MLTVTNHRLDMAVAGSTLIEEVAHY